MRHLLTTTALSRAFFNTDPVIINTGGNEPSADAAIIDQVVEARVEAALATETADEAAEVVEALENQVEGLAEWQMQQASRLSELEERCHLIPTREETEAMLMAMMEAQQSNISALILQQLSENREPSSLTATEEAEILTEEAAEAIAENPELGAVIVTAENSTETATEASSETGTEPHDAAAVSVVAVSAEAMAPRHHARLV
jgi:ATP-dependent protease HslVU (ClpYQ) ATPase subunit